MIKILGLPGSLRRNSYNRAFLDVAPYEFRYSRETLTTHGNIASAVVLDALRRLFDDDEVPKKGCGLIAGFGPGITAEITLGEWV